MCVYIIGGVCTCESHVGLGLPRLMQTDVYSRQLGLIYNYIANSQSRRAGVRRALSPGLSEGAN
jgi:hypothetical protein